MADRQYTYIDPKFRTRLAQIALTGLIVLYLVQIANFIAIIRTRETFFSGTVARDVALGLLKFEGGLIVAISVPTVFLIFVEVVIFLCWLYRVSANVHADGADVEASPAFAVGMYFIPFYNLFVPPVAMSEIARASVSPTDWREQPKWKVVPVWWLLQIISNVMGMYVMVFEKTGGTAPNKFSQLVWTIVIGSALNIALHSSQLFLVTRVAAAQRNRAHS